LEHELGLYQKCPEDHTPNEIAKKALDKLKKRKDFEKADTVEAFYKIR
jgi:hypothetical protein